MDAGRELDALIAEKVFGLNLENGWLRSQNGDPKYWQNKNNEFITDSFAPYSTDIKDAWEVVEKVKTQLGEDAIVIWFKNGEWTVVVEDFNYLELSGLNSKAWASAKTAPHAICLAALKAVGYEPRT